MRAIKYVAAFALLAFALSASATCTWTSTGTYSWKVVCTTGNESAPTLVTEGAALPNLKALSVFALADTGQTFTATPSGTVAIYIYDDVAGRWGRCRSCGEPTIDAVSEREDAFPAFTVPVSRNGRFAVVPISVTLSSGGVTFYVNGQP